MSATAAAMPPRVRNRRPSRVLIRHSILTVILVPVAFLWLYPILWMVSGSLKNNSTIFTDMSLIPSAPEWMNFAEAWWNANIGSYFWNTVFVTGSVAVIVVIITSLMGYVLGTFIFPGKRVILAVLVGMLFVPEGYTIIPLFHVLTTLGLSKSLAGLVVAESGSSQIIIIILLFTGYFRQLPRELVEAARLDGAHFLRTFWSVALPLAKPVIATAVIMTITRVWNDFFIPLVLTLSRPEQRTLAVGIYAFQGENQSDWVGMTAASTVSILPIVIAFLLLQRYFVEGIAGAVRG